jgi:hypothetical protein
LHSEYEKTLVEMIESVLQSRGDQWGWTSVRDLHSMWKGKEGNISICNHRERHGATIEGIV